MTIYREELLRQLQEQGVKIVRLKSRPPDEDLEDEDLEYPDEVDQEIDRIGEGEPEPDPPPLLHPFAEAADRILEEARKAREKEGSLSFPWGIKGC